MAVFQHNLCQEISFDPNSSYLFEHLRIKPQEPENEFLFLSNLNYFQFSTFQSVKLILQNPNTYDTYNCSNVIYSCYSDYYRLETIYLNRLKKYVPRDSGRYLSIGISRPSPWEYTYGHGNIARTYYTFRLLDI